MDHLWWPIKALNSSQPRSKSGSSLFVRALGSWGVAATGQLKGRRKVIYSLFPSTVSSQFKCRAGKSSRAEGELGWGQPGLPRAGLAAHPHLQDNGRNKELLGAQTSLLAQSWNQVKSDPSLSLEHLPACRKLSREATPGHGHQALPSGKGPLP